MLNTEALFSDCDTLGLFDWKGALSSLLEERTSDQAHGDLAKWKEIVRQLPTAPREAIPADAEVVAISGDGVSTEETARIQSLLKGLLPWRKGPFNILGVDLDAEWRSDLKWNRIRRSIEPLDGRNILDVGCGNGYYAFRMKSAGAARIIGVDPTILFICQFLALIKMSGVKSVYALPLRLHELPTGSQAFDTTFSMGVLYHQRDPIEHLTQLRNTLRPGGEIVLETLVLPGDKPTVLRPEGRYARMRNVWHLPTVPTLESWLDQAGLKNTRVADVSQTTVAEQRTTPWMPFESLAESLDSDDASLTIEGLPCPTRAVLICNAP